MESWGCVPGGGRKGGEMNGWHRAVELKKKKKLKCREMERLVDVTGEEWAKKRRVDGKMELIV